MCLSRIASLLAVVMLVACVGGTHAPAATAQSGGSDLDAGTDADAGEDVADDGDGGTDENPIATDEPAGPCPTEMVLIEGEGVRVCVDRWEASLVEVDGDGNEKPYPHWMPVDGHNVRAVSQPEVFPQGYISEVQAEDACEASHKRLCQENEWMTACTGPMKTTYPYGEARKPTACHDSGRSAVGAVFGAQALASSPPPPAPKPTTKGKPAHSTSKKAASTTKTRPTKPGAKVAATTKRPGAGTATNQSTKKKGQPKAAKASTRPAEVQESVWTKLNDPRLGQVDGALAKTGTHGDCTNDYGALDMMGNLHEWVKTSASLPHGTFCGGYYLDTTLNGDGCKYRTKAHAHDYHDYSTGFRCCSDPR